MNLGEVKNLTLKILETPEKFTSNDFVEVYNTIYKHCTEKSEVFVVKGKDVYDCLKSVLISYFESLKPICSLKSFNRLAVRFVESLNLLTSVFSYLERYYIKSSINIRDGYTLDTTTLSYTIFYSHFLSSYLENLTDYILLEIDFQRNSQKPKFESISLATSNLKTILLYNDLADLFDDLVNRYYKNFFNYIKETSITNLVHKTYVEIELSQHFFGFTLRTDLLKLTYCISRNYKEILDLYVEEYESLDKSSSLIHVAGLNDLTDSCPESLNESILKNKLVKNNLFSYFAKLFYYVKEEQAAVFLKRHSQLVFKELENIKLDELVLYYIDSIVIFQNVPISTSVVLQPLKEYLKRVLSNVDHENMFVELIEEIRSDKNEKLNYLIKGKQYKTVKKTFIFELIMKTIKLSPSFEKIISKITANIQHRLISNNESYDCQEFENTIEMDNLLIASIEKIYGVSYISWLKISIDRFLQPLKQNFGISNQEEDLMVEMRLLTKGFWNIKPSAINLHPTLKGIENILLKQNLLMFPRSEIVTCYRVSPAIFSLNEFDFRVSTDVLSLIMFFSDCVSGEEIKIKSKDPNFEFNLRLLIDNYILLENNGEFFINGDFSQSDYERILENVESTKRSKGTRLIDLFKVEFENLASKKYEMTKNNHLESAIEAFIVRTLKKKKKMRYEDLMCLINKNYDFNKIDDILEKLESKEYVKKDIVDDEIFILYLV